MNRAEFSRTEPKHGAEQVLSRAKSIGAEPKQRAEPIRDKHRAGDKEWSRAKARSVGRAEPRADPKHGA